MSFNTNPVELVKAITGRSDTNFQQIDVTDAISRKPLKPRLLTSLISPREEMLMTDTFKFSKNNVTAEIPGAKLYSHDGKYVKKDRAEVFRYGVASRGLVATVSPKDYMNRTSLVNPGQLMTEAEVVSLQMEKLQQAWALHEELDLVTLITTDTARVIDPLIDEAYDYHEEIVGAVRGAKTPVDFSGADSAVITTVRTERTISAENVMKAGDSASMWICLCGDTFFQAIYEVESQLALGRELRRPFDPASQSMPQMSDGDFGYIDHFEGRNGIVYVNYGGEIIAGQSFVATNDAYLVPMGGRELIVKAYAPAVTREHVNKQALKSYDWTHEDFRQGVSVVTESNSLSVLTNPAAIRHLTATNI